MGRSRQANQRAAPASQGAEEAEKKRHVKLTDIDTVIVPVCTGHVLVDICVDPCHVDG